MAEKKSFRDIKDEVVRNGGYHVNFYFDLHSNSKEALRDVMVGFVGKLTNEDGVRFGVGEIDEPLDHQDLYSTTAKVTLLVESLPALMRLCLAYGPIGIEIEEPFESRLTASEIQSVCLQASGTAQEFTNLVLTKIMTPEEKAEYAKKMGQRVLLGRRLSGKKDLESK